MKAVTVCVVGPPWEREHGEGGRWGPWQGETVMDGGCIRLQHDGGGGSCGLGCCKQPLKLIKLVSDEREGNEYCKSIVKSSKYSNEKPKRTNGRSWGCQIQETQPCIQSYQKNIFYPCPIYKRLTTPLFPINLGSSMSKQKSNNLVTQVS